MKSIKIAIEDYIFAFRTKSRAEKIIVIRKITLEIIIAIILMCSPFLITRCGTDFERDLRSRVDPTLSMEQKWDLLRRGRMHIACNDDADEQLRQVGLDPTTDKALEYALEHGWCEFVLTE